MAYWHRMSLALSNCISITYTFAKSKRSPIGDGIFPLFLNLLINKYDTHRKI